MPVPDAGTPLPSGTCLDVDGDGFVGTGDCAGHGTLDCDDGNPLVFPGAAEVCNGHDDNCDGVVDEGQPSVTYYRDADGDGVGGSEKIASCLAQPKDTSSTTGDCDDSNAAVHPGATEVCNGLDDDCDGTVDNGLTRRDFYADADGDGHGDAKGAAQPSCLSAVSGWVPNHDDCDDTNARVAPGAPEVCNGLDDNCDGQIDEGLGATTYFTDADGDGFGSSTARGQSACAPVPGSVTNALDCDDANPAIKPGAAERCNAADDNCDGRVDEGNPGGGGACGTGRAGVCAAGLATCAAGSVQCLPVTGPTAELCNGLDDDCNGVLDDGFVGLGAACSAGQGACQRSGLTVCNGAGTAVTCSATPGSPTAPACDGVDNDCDGVVDEPVLSSTTDLTTTAWTDLEVRPYYYSSGSCAGGVNGAGADALQGGALLMGGGATGIALQPLTTTGAPSGGLAPFTSLAYSDVDFAQAGDGFVVAGVWANNNAEVDLYYVDALGGQRAIRYTNFKYPLGCSGGACHTLDSLRVVRGNGKRVTVIWREATEGIVMAQLEPCFVGGSWEFRAPGCATTTLTLYTVSSGANIVPGVGADSTHLDWAPSQTCSSTASLRRLGLGYLSSTTSVSFFTINEDASGKSAETVAYSVSALTSLAEPEVAFFKDAANIDQFFLAYVRKDALFSSADLDFWLTSDPTWHYAYFADATQNGIDSIARPRISVSSTSGRVQLSAVRWVADSSSFKTQVMTRQTDLAGNRTPLGTDVELSVTSGSCGVDAACRPGNKAGFTNWLPFGRVYYSAAGATPSGTVGSVLTCN